MQQPLPGRPYGKYLSKSVMKGLGLDEERLALNRLEILLLCICWEARTKVTRPHQVIQLLQGELHNYLLSVNWDNQL